MKAMRAVKAMRAMGRAKVTKAVKAMQVPKVAVINNDQKKPNEKWTYANARNVKEIWVENWTDDKGRVCVKIWMLDSS